MKADVGLGPLWPPAAGESCSPEEKTYPCQEDLGGSPRGKREQRAFLHMVIRIFD